MKAFVDSACDIKYASFYIEGLRQVLGKSNVMFNSSRFQDFPHNNFYLPIQIESGEEVYKIVIDYSDWSIIRPLPYEWCDLYCKINIAFEDAGKPKLFSIGPGFGIRIFGLFASAVFGVRNLWLSGDRIGSKRRFLYDYYGQFKRPALKAYRNTRPAKKGYVFFASSLWKNDTATNDFRANFIRAAKSVANINFEGGFAPRARNDIPGFGDMTLAKRVGTLEYVEKTKMSMAVFSTPAVAMCHGWKLGEFLAMGKAILSTPLTRMLPEDLIDGKHFLVTDGSQKDLAKKLAELLENDSLRQDLERNAASYYERNLSPKAVIESILGKLGIAGHKPTR